MNLNPGGIIGALVCIGVLLAMMFSAGDDGPRRFGKIMLLAGLVGGGIGNFLWSAVFGKKSDASKDEDVPTLSEDDGSDR
jgi:hypothetical protein